MVMRSKTGAGRLHPAFGRLGRGHPYVVLGLLGLALSACAAPTGSGDKITGSYQCDGGKTFSFTTERGSETVTLELDGKSYQLQQQPVAGRTLYSDGTLDFWTRNDGRFATLEGTAEPFSNCEDVAWQGGGVGLGAPDVTAQ